MLLVQSKIRDFEFDYSTKDMALRALGTSRSSQRVRVLEAFLSCRVEGATDAEVAELLGVDRTSVIARRHEIIRECPDILVVIGKRKNAVSGCLNDVWMSVKDSIEREVLM